MVPGTNYGSWVPAKLSYFKIVGLLIIFSLLAGGKWSSTECLYQYELYPLMAGLARSLLAPVHRGQGRIIFSRHFTPRTGDNTIIPAITASSVGLGEYEFGEELSLIFFIKIEMAVERAEVKYDLII